jgi:adenylate cyclase class 2
MATEIEAKLKVDSLQVVKQRLSELGAEFLQEQLQTDDHYDDADMTLNKAGRALRLRRQLVGDGRRFFVTYKGPREKSEFKKRQEIEFEILDGDSAQKLLFGLGYEKVMTVEKKRMLWRLGDCEVALDHLPLLGDFVEIEGPDEAKIIDTQRNLGLSDVKHVPKSYSALMRDKLRELGRA